MKRLIRFLLCVLLTMAVGGVSGIATISGVNGWYKTLNKPSFNPPNGVFGPVWSLLYLLMGVSLFLVWQRPASAGRGRALTIFFMQITLNFFWSILFFNLHAVGWALAEILVMWLAILAMIITFYKVSPPAALLQIPYLCWVSFASVLNAAIYHLN